MKGAVGIGLMMTIAGLAGAAILKFGSITFAYTVNLTYVHLSFWPFLTMFIFALGIATAFFGAVHSGALSLITFIAALLMGIYIWSLFFGLSGLFGFGIPTGLPGGLRIMRWTR